MQAEYLFYKADRLGHPTAHESMITLKHHKSGMLPLLRGVGANASEELDLGGCFVCVCGNWNHFGRVLTAPLPMLCAARPSDAEYAAMAREARCDALSCSVILCDAL